MQASAEEKLIKHIKADVLTLHLVPKARALYVSAKPSVGADKTKTEDKQSQLTLPLLLRDLVVKAVDVVPVILGLVRAQGCARQAEHAQHAPETPRLTHDTSGNVLLLLLLLVVLLVADVSAGASGEGRQLCLSATRVSLRAALWQLVTGVYKAARGEVEEGGTCTSLRECGGVVGAGS